MNLNTNENIFSDFALIIISFFKELKLMQKKKSSEFIKIKIAANLKRIFMFIMLLGIIITIDLAYHFLFFDIEFFKLTFIPFVINIFLIVSSLIYINYIYTEKNCAQLFVKFSIFSIYSLIFLSLGYLIFATSLSLSSIFYIFFFYIFLAIFPVLNFKQSIFYFTLLACFIISIFSYFSLIDQVFIETLFLVHVFSLILSQILYINYRKNVLAERANQKEVNKLKNKSERDNLTLLLNRDGLSNGIKSTLDVVINKSILVSVLMIDIDYFKNFNDTFGHFEGDKCLKKIATCIKNTVKSKTDIVCRFGGEEFLVFLNNVNLNQTIDVAKRINSNILKLKIPAGKKDVNKYVTVSIGIANGGLKKYKDFENLCSLSDEKLYECKNSGRNSYKYIVKED